MMVCPRPVAALPAAAAAAVGTVGGMVPGAVDGDQRMAAGHRPPLQHLSAPRRRVDAREAAAEVPGAGPVQPLAHPGVRRRPPHAEGRAEVPRHHRITAAADLPAGPRQRRCPAGEHRGARHQAVGKADATRAARVGDAVEACADRPQHAGHRQMLSQGIPGHFPARLLPVCPQNGRSGVKSPRKKFATPAQQTDNERKEFLAGIAGRTRHRPSDGSRPPERGAARIGHRGHGAGIGQPNRTGGWTRRWARHGTATFRLDSPRRHGSRPRRREGRRCEVMEKGS